MSERWIHKRLSNRAEAAHLYQAKVRLGQAQPLPVNVAAANYIVGGPGAVSQTPPTTPEETVPTDYPNSRCSARSSHPWGFQLQELPNFGLTGDSALGDGIDVGGI